MEIVIKIHDIPQNDHERWVLKKGTPLPKGHGRLIDESLLIEDMKCIYKAANDLVALGFAESCIEHIPTIIEADKEGSDGDSY